MILGTFDGKKVCKVYEKKEKEGYVQNEHIVNWW